MIRFVVVILFLAIAVVLFFTQTKPQFNEIQALKIEKQSFDEALQYSREFQALKDDLLSRYNAISTDDLKRLDKILPSDFSSGVLITTLEDRAKNRGLLLKKIDITEEKAGQSESFQVGALPSPFRTFGLTLVFSGPYTTFLSFLDDLEKSVRIIDVDQIDFTAGANNIIEFKIVAKTYANYPLVIPNIVVLETKGEEAQAILAILTKLKKIGIDSDFFQSEVFKGFSDFAPIITLPTDYGRPNPFLPIQ